MPLNDHKLRQEMFHKLEPLDDILQNIEHIVELNQTHQQLVDSVCTYFIKPIPVLSFPSKSYAVAIIYSLLLEQYFNIPFFTSINHPKLFVDNDKYFVCYNEGKSVYDAVLTKLHTCNINPIELELPQVLATLGYFKKEFYITPNSYFNNI